MSKDAKKLEITRFTSILWASNKANATKKFKELISDDEVFAQFFGKDYLQAICEKRDRFKALNLKLGIFYFVAMIILFASQFSRDVDFQIFGFSFKNIGYYKEFLLLLLAILVPFSSFINAYSSLLEVIIDSCIEKLAPDPVTRKFYKHRWRDSGIDILLEQDPSIKHVFPHATTWIISLLAFLLMAGLLLLAYLGFFFVQVAVIYDIIVNPVAHKYVNLFVVIFSISSIVLSFIMALMQLPMPSLDYRNLYRLEALQENAPQEYERVVGGIRAKITKKEARAILIGSSILYFAVYTAMTFAFDRRILENIESFLPTAIAVGFVVMLFSNQLSILSAKIAYKLFFRVHKSNTQESAAAFKKLETQLIWLKVLFTTALSVSCWLYVN